MFFKRSKSSAETYRYPGQPRALDGYTAALGIEAAASDAVIVTAGDESSAAAGRGAAMHAAPDVAAAAGRVTGASASGLRAATIVDSLAAVHPSLYAAAGKPLTSVYHLVCRSLARHTGAMQGGHDDYFAVSDAGLFQFFARGAQEVADYTLIARAVAERALTPGIVAQDYYRTSHSVQPLAFPERELIDEYLGRPGDVIDSPTPAQEIVFGKTRRRVPRLVDTDHPAGIGGLQDTESHFKAMAAQRVYFASHLREMIAAEFERFAGLTGRHYAEASGYRIDDADVVIVAQGAIVDELEAAADYARERENIKVGVVDLAVFRPFPGAALVRMLRGRRAVAVMERSDRPLADTLPLTAEIRAAIDRSIENGTAGEPVHPDYDAWRPNERPRVTTAVYGTGGELPGNAELVALIRELAGKPRPLVYVGLGEDASIRRFPHLHSLQQALNRDYPARHDTALPAAEVEPAPAPVNAARLYSLSMQGGIFAGNIFARALAEGAGATARTFPQGGLEASAHTATLTITFSDETDVRHRPDVVDTVLVAGGKLVEDVSSRDDLTAGGTLIVETERPADAWWTSLSRRTGRWIHDRKLRVVTIDAARIAAEAASKPSTIDQLSIWALLGAYASLRLDSERMERLVGGVRERLAAILGDSHYLVDDVTGAIRAGAEGVTEVDCSAFSTDDLAAASDGEAPWTVRDVSEWEANTFDTVRFWHSVGYLYDSGQADRALSDPHLGTGIIPARSSAFRDMTPYRLRIPHWLVENCTGCGDCWSMCPDSALPPTIQTVSSILQAAMTQAEKNGVALVQLKRFSEHLAKQAYKLLAGDGMNQYPRVGELFDDAFDRLVDKLGLDEDKQAALRDEFTKVLDGARALPLAKTELFFDRPHGANKGSGMALSIALNPLACTGCGVCVDVCPDAALEWVEQTPERVADSAAAWSFHMALPDPDERDIQRFVDDAGSDVHRLLERNAYHTLVGGDGSFPGNAAKTAVRLVAAAAESRMGPRYREYAAKLAGLIERLQGKIQGDVAEVLKINDFEDFSRRLDRLATDTLSPDQLASALGDESGPRAIDPERLRALTRLHDRLVELKAAYESGADGHGRARVVMTIDTESVRLWAGTYPYNPLPYPWICHVPGDGIDVAAGTCDGIARRIAEESALVRRAELELDDAYDAAAHGDQLAALSVDDLEPEERALIPPVLVLGETGTTALDDASALMLCGAPVGLVLLDAIGPTPGAADMETGLVALSRNRATVVQSSVGTPGHLMRGVGEAIDRGGPMLVRVFAPDPHASGIAAEKTASHARLAVESRAVPLFTAAGGEVAIGGNPDADGGWAVRELVFREPSGAEAHLETPATPADWAVNEARFQEHFRVIPKGQMADAMIPLDEYLATGEDEREQFEPVIHFPGAGQRHLVAVVSDDMTSMCASRLAIWTWLRSLGSRAPQPVTSAAEEQPAAPPPPPPPPSAEAVGADAQEALTRRLLQLSGFSDDPEFFKRSLRDFVVARNVGSTTPAADDDGPARD